MHIHILGIAGTFMGGIALIAKELGHQVSGQDNHIYPPMSEQLILQNIDFTQSYDVENLPDADLYIIGNALTRGNQCVEHILSKQLNYTSGAAWLGVNVLKNKWVIAVSGTHGKTTTASIITHILVQNNLNPSFLIGGICQNFGVSSRLTDSLFFVIEADEYDTAFFDKRSKFIHYHPNTLVINNIEFDHGDIFKSIDDIYTQFHHLIRTLPKEAQIIYPVDDNIQQVLTMGLWSENKAFEVPQYRTHNQQTIFEVEGFPVTWNMLGVHNVNNALSAIYACLHAGITIQNSTQSLNSFQGVKRRLEVRFKNNNVTIYDDFAHHPTSIQTTISGLRQQVTTETIIIALELRSNTMKMGYFDKQLIQSLKGADEVLVLKGLINGKNVTKYTNTDDMITTLKNKTGHIVFMSNGDFNNIIDKLIEVL